MIELIWGIINILAFCYFVVIIFRATKIVRENMGGFTTLILIFGLFSFIGKPKEENDKIKIFDLKNENKKIESNELSINNQLQIKKVEDNLCNNYQIFLNYKKDEKEKNEIKLLSATIHRNGLACGTKYKTTSIILNSIGRNIYEYEILGTIDWSLGGIKFYTEIKDIKGKIEIN